jgi:hypothetical protein
VIDFPDALDATKQLATFRTSLRLLRRFGKWIALAASANPVGAARINVLTTVRASGRISGHTGSVPGAEI